MSDLILVQAFANEPEAQVTAAALRAAGFHPVVLGHDALAQLLDPGRGARVLVPAGEVAEAREVLGLERLAERGARTSGMPGLPALASVFTVAFGLAAYLAPRFLPVIAVIALATWIAVRRSRRSGEPG